MLEAERTCILTILTTMPYKKDITTSPGSTKAAPMTAALFGWGPGLLTVITLALTLSACSTVDIGGPSASKRDPEAGILKLPGGRRIAILPSELNFTGKATYTWPDGHSRDGYWQSGQLQGMGTENLSTEVYTGQWLDNQRHGHGEVASADGSRYVGDFSAGLPAGKGTRSSKSGVYRGTWLQGQRHGQGQFNAADQSTYQGQWQAGQRSGNGQQEYANGDAYVGSWGQDKPQGFGRFFFANGATYEGSWEAGQRSGYGTWQSPADIRFEGTWLADQRQGFGKESRPDGSFFAGMWQADQRHGKGAEVYADGSAHRGLWQDDKIAGQGSRTNRAGIVISGDWQQNRILSGSLLLPEGPKYRGPLFSADGHSIAATLISWLGKQAAAQHAHAQFFLASALLDFESPAADERTARVWLNKASDAGITEAQFRLADILINEDTPTALSWLRKAAQRNHPDANERLGSFFHTGLHLQRDYTSAIQHYRVAAKHGSINATNNLAWMLATSTVEEISDPEQAIELIRPLVLYLGNWQHMDTLAAAHARVGETELAKRLQTQALVQAQNFASAQIIEDMTARLTLYTAGHPYTEE